MPYFLPVCMVEASWKVLPSRMRLRTAGVQMSTSSAATRPLMSIRLSRVWDTTALSASARVERTCPCCSWGKISMTRSTVFMAFRVCRVPNTRWPVMDASMARAMVSRSRISPTRMMSGSSRRAPRRAAEKLLVCVPTSR